MNIGVGSIITKGLGGPADNLLIFGPLHLYIEPFVIAPTPSPTVPIPTPAPSGVGGGGGGVVSPAGYDDDDEDDEATKYKLTFVLKFRSRIVKRTFIVDSFKKDKIIGPCAVYREPCAQTLYH